MVKYEERRMPLSVAAEGLSEECDEQGFSFLIGA
jgi:hypothetical protein